jgi:acyl carrier protein
MFHVESEIRAFLAENFPLGADANRLASDASLLEAGVIDSTGVLELIGFLESQYGIEVADDELLPENLDSIASIVRYVDGKLASAVQAGGARSAHA